MITCRGKSVRLERFGHSPPTAACSTFDLVVDDMITGFTVVTTRSARSPL